MEKPTTSFGFGGSPAVLDRVAHCGVVEIVLVRGTFRDDGGVTKPTKQDADVIDHQIVTSPSDLEVWMKIPLKTAWRHVDLKKLFIAQRLPRTPCAATASPSSSRY